MGKKTYHIVVIGCQMNKSDSERISSYLEDFGFVYEKEKYKANLVIITTCGVRQSAENRIYGMIPRIKKENPKSKIILTGCLSGRSDVKKRLDKWVSVWLPIIDLQKLGTILEIHEKPHSNISNYLKITPKYSSKFTAFIPIGNGCDNYCSYCVVPYARGREKYRKFNDIMSEIKILLHEGYREIVLIAQNVNSYKSGDKNFSALLGSVNEIEGDFWIRFATSHPKDMNNELIRTMAHSKKVCEHIHLPAQSGDDTILKAMNRGYNSRHYYNLVEKIRDTIEKKRSKKGVWTLPVSLSTDIIVGFPGETKRQHKNTVRMFKEIKFDMAFVSQYSPRPGTAAEKLNDNVKSEEKRSREDEFMNILNKTSENNSKKYIGKEVEVLIEGRKKNGLLFGNTRTSKVVKLEDERGVVLVGKFVKVVIDKTDGAYLFGKIKL